MEGKIKKRETRVDKLRCALEKIVSEETKGQICVGGVCIILLFNR